MSSSAESANNPAQSNSDAVTCKRTPGTEMTEIKGFVRRAALVSEAVETMEVPWEDGARLINECTYLFATDVREIEELTLGLTIVEAKAQAPISTTEDTGPLASLKIGGRPIEEDETCRLFQLLFDR